MLSISDDLKQKYTGDLLPPDIVLNIAGTTYTNKDFTSGSLKIKESLCSKDTLDLTSVEASSLKVTIANEDGNVKGLAGKRVTAKQGELDLGVYTIANAKLSTDYTTDIECYDDLKKFVDTDVSDWWNTQLVFPLSLKDLLIKLCDRVGVPTELPNAWTNSDMQVTKTAYFQNLKASELLGYIQEASGTFFRMSRTGKLKAISPNKTPTEIPYTRLFNDATISDTETKAIEKLSIKSSEKDLGVSSGNEDGNAYLILANPLLFGLSTAQMKTISDKLFPAYKWQAYKPCKASYKSLPYLEVGDWVTVTTFKGSVATFPILSRELNDVNLLADTVEAKGKKEQKKTVSSAKQIQVLSWNVHEMENTLETFKSKIENITTEVGNANKGTKQYYLQTASTNKPSKTDSAWSETQPASISGQHMWYMLVDITANGSEIRHEPFELTGIKGESGRGIVGNPTLTYQASTSATVIPTGTWSSDIPLVNEGYTLWTKTTWKYSDNTTSEVYTPSIAGKAGKGIKSVKPEYYLSTSKVEATGGTWQETQPQKTADTWIWKRYRTTFTDESVGYSEPTKDDVLNGVYDVTSSNKSAIEQLNNSVNLSVQETTAIKKSLQSTNDDLHALEAQTQQYATKAELQLTKDSISQTLTEEIDGKTAVLKQIKLQSDGMHIQGKEGSTTEQVLDEKSSKIVVNGKVMVDVNSTETRVQSLKAEGNFATGAHKFKRGTMKEISGETVACTNIYWIGGE
nr:MAG TPA: tail protein [Caudoviricetes sp.]